VTARHRQGPNQGSTTSRYLQTPQMGTSEVVGREMRAGLDQILRGRANKPAQAIRALRVTVPLLGRQQLRALASAGAGAPSDEMSRASAEERTSVRKCCCGFESTQSRSGGQGRRVSNRSPGSICSRQDQNLITSHRSARCRESAHHRSDAGGERAERALSIYKWEGLLGRRVAPPV